ncbi:MAG: hypothetical protein LUD17_01780 [Bacteroidales bacterium]|nr:hypothetical protein [Bacteroidales bacterium]
MEQICPSRYSPSMNMPKSVNCIPSQDGKKAIDASAVFYQHLQDWNRHTMLNSTLDFDNPSFQGRSPLTP